MDDQQSEPELEPDDLEYHERKVGVYPAVFIGVKLFEYEDKATKEIVKRWRWVFQDIDDDTTAGEMDTLTSRSFKARTNGLKLWSGILGRKPVEGEKVSSSYGRTVNVVWGANSSDKLTITDVLPYTAPANAAPPAPLVADLPNAPISSELAPELQAFDAPAADDRDEAEYPVPDLPF